MKQNDLKDINYKLSSQHYENIFSVYEDEEIGYFYNLLKTVNFPEELSPDVYNIYIIRPQDTWPLISWRVYNTVFLWWAICAANNIQNPTEMPPAGTEIKILDAMYLRTILSTIQTE